MDPIRYEVGLPELRGMIAWLAGECSAKDFRAALEDHGWSPASAREFIEKVRLARGQVLAARHRGIPG